MSAGLRPYGRAGRAGQGCGAVRSAGGLPDCAGFRLWTWSLHQLLKRHRCCCCLLCLQENVALLVTLAPICRDR